MVHSIRRAVCRKPHPDYPLTPRSDGRWCKKVRGKLYIFSGAADEALEEWLRVKDDLLAGRAPRPRSDGLTVAGLFNAFLSAKQSRVDSDELDKRTWQDYYRACEKVISVFGKTMPVEHLTPEDFEELRQKLAKDCSPVSVRNAITRIRVAFDWGFKNDRLPRPVRYGTAFERPSRKVLLQARQKAGTKLFSREEVTKLLAAAGVQMKAMILLAINTGIGNSDLARLPIAAVAGGWLDFPRIKTAAPRRAKLWPHTVKAIQAVMKDRTQLVGSPYTDLLFITKYGKPWVTYSISKDDDGKPDGECSKDAIAGEFKKLMNALGIKRPGVGFYTLRHTYRTIADATKDVAAINLTMGHSDPASDMGAVYRQVIEDERLVAVSEHVRMWLFSKEAKPQARKRKSTQKFPAAGPATKDGVSW